MTQFDIPRATTTDAIAGYAKWFPRQEAIVCGEQRVDWRTFNDGINRVANALLRRGLGKGDRVCVLMQSGIEMATVIFGILKAGGVLVPLSTMVTPEALDMMLRDAGACLVFAAEGLLERIQALPARYPQVLPGGFVAMGGGAPGWVPYAEFLAPEDAREPGVVIGMGDNFVIMYSSGTTGAPKGIVHTHFSRLMLAMGRGLSFRFDRTARTLLTTPMYNNGTWVPMLATVHLGGTLVVMPRFDPGEFLALVEREHCTHTLMVPTQYIVTLAHPDFGRHDLSSLRVMISVGSPLRKDTKAQIIARFPGQLFELYGLTEGVGTVLTPEEMADKLGSVGRPYMGGDIRIIDDAGRELPRGEIGEIVGYGTGLMRGYHNKPEQTAAAIWRDEQGRSYMKTGDIGRLDEDGFLYVLDRKKDMIISGGVNIYASDIEAIFGEHPDVRDVTVIAIPHDKWGETPLALVIPADHATTSAEDLARWANARLGKYQRVARVEFRAEFPRNALGKVLKRELREHYAKTG